MTTPHWRVLAEGITRDVRRWYSFRRALRSVTPYTPPLTPERWVIVELSDATGNVLRYWRGTDRDHWHRDAAYALTFATERVALLTAQQFLLDIYYPRYASLRVIPL